MTKAPNKNDGSQPEPVVAAAQGSQREPAVAASKGNQSELVMAAARGSKAAFCALYEQYRDRLYRYAFYRTGDSYLAEDAVSECILAAWTELSSLRAPDAFAVWLFRILHNKCAAAVRRLMSERGCLEKLGTDTAVSSCFTDSTDNSLSLELAEALNSLSEDERETVLLSAVSGLSSSEISAVTGLTPGAVRSRLTRSYKKMRKFLEMGKDK